LVADLNEKSGFLRWGMGQQTVYDLAEKHAFGLYLIKKNLVGSDSVYELNEIATGPGACTAVSLPLRRQRRSAATAILQLKRPACDQP
jgi:hypothetical protein